MLTIIESLTYSIPIVMYDLPYLLTVKDNPGIITVKQRDTDAAVKELYDLLSDRNRLTEIGDNGRKHIEEMYCVDIGKQWRLIFDSIGTPKFSPIPDTKMMCDTLIRDYYDGALLHKKLQNDFKEKRSDFDKLQAEYNETSDLLNKLRADFNEKCGETNKLQAEFNKERNELYKLRAEYNKKCYELNKLQADYNKKNGELNRKNREIKSIYDSLSFRVGRFITFIPRKIREVLNKKRLKE